MSKNKNKTHTTSKGKERYDQMVCRRTAVSVKRTSPTQTELRLGIVDLKSTTSLLDSVRKHWHLYQQQRQPDQWTEYMKRQWLHTCRIFNEPFGFMSAINEWTDERTIKTSTTSSFVKCWNVHVCRVLVRKTCDMSRRTPAWEEWNENQRRWKKKRCNNKDYFQSVPFIQTGIYYTMETNKNKILLNLILL